MIGIAAQAYYSLCWIFLVASLIHQTYSKAKKKEWYHLLSHLSCSTMITEISWYNTLQETPNVECNLGYLSVLLTFLCLVSLQEKKNNHQSKVMQWVTGFLFSIHFYITKESTYITCYLNPHYSKQSWIDAIYLERSHL